MGDTGLRQLVQELRTGRMQRREFMAHVVGLGLTVPMAATLAAHSAGARAQGTAGAYKPTRRGGGGTLRCLFWQAPTLLNPHFATGSKDMEAARVFYEPLAAYDADGLLVPVLAAEIPSRANGGLSADGRSVTWKLKRGVAWHDGRPFTADDCLFNWRYANDPAAAATTIGGFRGYALERLDDHTVRVVFERPTPFWERALGLDMLVPRHRFEAFMGAKSREAPANLAPVGTGPYVFTEFQPGDLLRGRLNPNYHMANRPHFDAIEVKGGGDATSAARAVMQAGEYDYAWNLQVEDEILKRLETGGKGKITITQTGNIEFILLNTTDPWNEVDGERGSIKSKHPAFQEKAVRDAMALLVDRKGVQDFIYGRTGFATPNFLNNPPRVRSPNMKFEFNVEKANQILEAAGWKKGADGIRAKGNVKLKFVYQTSVNQPRQKTQAIVKDACTKAGVDLELKSVTAAVFFGSDSVNPDTYQKFWTDMQMYTTTMTDPDPQVFMNQFISGEVSQKVNKWEGRNICRWRNADYDRAYTEVQTEGDPAKRAALFIRLNDLVCSDNHIIPVVARPRVQAVGSRMVVHHSGWDNDLWALAHWHTVAG
jgi:peptide/nickel transport system substrate-binding protein